MTENETDTKLGEEFIEAFIDASDEYQERKRTMDTPGFYDPCGHTEAHLDEAVQKAMVRLVAAIRAIK